MNEFAPGHGLTNQQVETIRVLDWLYEATGPDHRTLVDLNELRTPLRRDADNTELLSWIDFLRRRDWLDELAATLSLGSGRLTHSGRRVIEEVRADRAVRSGRRMAAANGLVRWLPHDSDRFPDQPRYMSRITDFLESKDALFYGVPLADSEASAGAAWLAERELVDVLLLQGRPYRLRLSVKGEDLSDSGESVEQWQETRRRSQRQGGAVNVYGDRNVVTSSHNSPGASQSVNVSHSEQAELAANVADALSGLVKILGLSVGQRAEAAELVSQLRSEAESPQPRAGHLRTLLDKVAALVVAGTAPQMADGVLALIQQGEHLVGQII